MQVYQAWSAVERRLLVAGFMNCAISSGLIQAFSVFYVALIQEMGWSRASTASILSLGMVVLGLTTTLGGFLLGRLGPRWLMVISSVVTGAGLMLASRATTFTEFYLSYSLLVCLGMSMLGWIVQGAVMAPYFPGSRGLAGGIVFGGQGFGVLVLVFLSQFLIDRMGWRTAMLLLGLGILVVGSALNAWLQPVGHGYAGTPGRVRSAGSTLRSLWAAMGTVPFWAYAGVFAFTSASVYGMANHQAAFLVDVGYSATVGAVVVSVGGLLSILGRVLFGLLSDRIGQLSAGTLSFMASIGAFAILVLAKTLPWPILVLYTLLFGLGFGSRAPILSSLATEEFGGPAHGTIWGVMSLANSFGVGLGSWLIGLVFDNTGSYRAVFTASIVILILSNLSLAVGVKSSHRRRRAAA